MLGSRASVIDVDTPQEAHTYTSFKDNATVMQLVFSDEFNTDGRTFYPGDDPYWEAGTFSYFPTTSESKLKAAPSQSPLLECTY